MAAGRRRAPSRQKSVAGEALPSKQVSSSLTGQLPLGLLRCRGSRAGLEGEGKHGGDGRPASGGNPAWAGEGKHGGDGQPSLGGSSVATAPSLMLSWRRRCFLLGGERQRRGSKLGQMGQPMWKDSQTAIPTSCFYLFWAINHVDDLLLNADYVILYI